MVVVVWGRHKDTLSFFLLIYCDKGEGCSVLVSDIPLSLLLHRVGPPAAQEEEEERRRKRMRRGKRISVTNQTMQATTSQSQLS